MLHVCASSGAFRHLALQLGHPVAHVTISNQPVGILTVRRLHVHRPQSRSCPRQALGRMLHGVG